MNSIATPQTLAFLFFFIATPILAESEIQVSGTVTQQIAPDKMIWQLAIETKSPTIREAAETHDDNVQAALKLLDDQKIPRNDIQTNRIELSENQVRRGGEYKKEGYIASTQIVFESKELDQYRDLWIAVAELPAVSVNSVNLTSSKEIEVRKKARIMAIEAAREKAEVMAGVLKMRIGDPLRMSEGSVSTGKYSAFGDFDNGAGFFESNLAVPAEQPSDIGGSGSGLAPGTISIRAKVEITFQLVRAGSEKSK